MICGFLCLVSTDDANLLMVKFWSTYSSQTPKTRPQFGSTNDENFSFSIYPKFSITKAKIGAGGKMAI